MRRLIRYGFNSSERKPFFRLQRRMNSMYKFGTDSELTFTPKRLVNRLFYGGTLTSSLIPPK